MVHSHTAHLPLGALRIPIPCTTCGTGKGLVQERSKAEQRAYEREEAAKPLAR